jgi:hypothetical protein
MKLFAYRFIDDEGIPTGYYGVVGANSERDLFWAIDEFGDPYRCELRKLSNIGFCLKLSKEFLDNDCDDYTEEPYSELEFSDHVWEPFLTTEKFRKAVWSKEMIENLYSRQES